MGIDLNKLLYYDIRSENDNLDLDNKIQLIRDNLGKGKFFRSPEYFYKGQEVLGYVALTEPGGINGTIITNIFRNLDHLKILEEFHLNGLTPFVQECWCENKEKVNRQKGKWNTCKNVMKPTWPSLEIHLPVPSNAGTLTI